MSKKYGMDAINLVMSDKVPRTEYSADFHWDLINKVTGSNVNFASSEEERQAATSAFIKEWDYAFFWNAYAYADQFGTHRNDMGHAEYAQAGSDFENVKYRAFEDEDDVYALDPFEAFGEKDEKELIEAFNANYRKRCEQFPDTVNMTGVYITCMSGLIDMFGWELLLVSAGVDPKAFGETTNRYTEWILQYFKALAKCESEVVMVHDDIVWGNGAFMDPDWYREYIFKNHKKLLLPLQEAGKKILFTSDGNCTEFLDDIGQLGVNGFVMEPTSDMEYFAEKYGKTHAFVGNADTTILLTGTKDDIEKEVKRCMDIGKKYPGYIMSVGNHIPPNTPVDNCLWYNEFYEKYSVR